MNVASLAKDGVPLFVASLSLTVAIVVWLSLVIALRRVSWKYVLLALLVAPAPVLAWRAGFKKRAVALGVAIVLYVIVRVVFG